jgi:DNA-binding transcriptional MocR family regulator
MSKLEATRLARLLAGWDKGTNGPMPDRLASGLRELMHLGDVTEGTLLPAQRALASALGISRDTVDKAYARLREAGELDSRQGSGTKLRRKGNPIAAPARVDGRLASFSGHAEQLVDLSSGALEGLDFVGEALDKLNSADLADYVATDGYFPAGVPPLREAVAAYYRDLGLPTDSNQILITSGAQQAIWLLAQCLVEAGDHVVVEDPSYRGALEALRERGARILPVPMTDDGPDRKILDGTTRSTRPRLCYLLPTAHNPTGSTVSDAGREQLARLLNDRELFVVEDGSPAELLLDRDTPPLPLAQHIGADRSATIGTLSKLAWGGLRVGWIRTSAELVRRLAELKKPVDLGGPVAEQVVGKYLLDQVSAIRRRRRAWLIERYDRTDATLTETVPDWQWHRPSGGSGLWIRLPGVDVPTLTALARRHGIAVTAGTACSPTDGYRDRLRLPFAANPDVVRRAIPELAVLARDPRVAATKPRSESTA